MIVSDRSRRGARTAVTVTLSVVTVVLGLVPVILEAVQPLQEHLPGSWYLWLVGIAATIIAVATAVQRILTSDVVEQLLQSRAPALAAVSPAGVADITSLSPAASDAGTVHGLALAVYNAQPPGSDAQKAASELLYHLGI